MDEFGGLTSSPRETGAPGAPGTNKQLQHTQKEYVRQTRNNFLKDLSPCGRERWGEEEECVCVKQGWGSKEERT